MKASRTSFGIAEEKVPEREVSNTLALTAGHRVHADDKLRIVVLDFGKIAEFAFHRGFVGKQVGDLVVTEGSVFLAIKSISRPPR